MSQAPVVASDLDELPVAAPAARPRILDFISLTKPRLSSLVVFTMLGGLYLAPGRLPLRTTLLALLGTALVVGGANALNMYIERDSDAHMRRTMSRPLPAHRLTPRAALLFGLAIALASLPILALGVNLLTAGLAALALVSYVLVYTPMKHRSPDALLVGAVPGAIPPLMGWTAATGRVELPGLLLFTIMFVWQVPHFLAIAIYSADDFRRGGIRAMPLVFGDELAKRRILRFTAALVPISLALVPLGVAGVAYVAVALAGGIWFFVEALRGLRPDAGRAWARRLFLVSLAYLTAIFIVLAIEGRAHG